MGVLSQGTSSMVGQHSTVRIVLVCFLSLGSTFGQEVLLTSDCPVCVNVDLLPGEATDDLAGLYNFKGESAECPGGCSYNKAEDLETVYCFGPGVRTAQLECPATNLPGETSATEGVTEESTNALKSTNSVGESSLGASSPVDTTLKESTSGSITQLINTASVSTAEGTSYGGTNIEGSSASTSTRETASTGFSISDSSRSPTIFSTIYNTPTTSIFVSPSTTSKISETSITSTTSTTSSTSSTTTTTTTS